MKQTLKIVLLLAMLLTVMLSAVSCGRGESSTTLAPDDEGIWATATYKENTELGEGANTLTVTVEAQGKSVILTVHTNQATLGEALYELGLINDPSFFDTCNGMVADWDKDQAYWGFLEGGKMCAYGVDDERATTAGNPAYEIVYTQGGF